MKKDALFCGNCGMPVDGVNKKSLAGEKNSIWKVIMIIFSISVIMATAVSIVKLGYQVYKQKVLLEQKKPIYKEIYAGVNGKKYGYFLNEDGERIYDGIEGPDTNGNFIVRQGEKYGLVNEEGIEVIKPVYRMMEELSVEDTDKEGVYLVWKENKCGVITMDNACLVEEQEGQIEKVSIEQQLYKINLGGGDTQIRDFQGNIIIQGKNGDVDLLPNGCIKDYESGNIMTRDGTVLLYQQDETGLLEQIECFSDDKIGAGISYARRLDDIQVKKGLLTLDGKIRFPCLYDQIYYISDKDVFFYSKDQKTGVMKSTGEILWEQDYDFGFVFLTEDRKRTEDAMLVKRGGNYGLVDIKTGKTEIECEYSYISKDSQNEKSWFWKKGEKSGFWNQKNGTYVEIPYKGGGSIEGFHSGSDSEIIYVYDYSMGDFLRIHEENGTGVIDREGNYVIEPKYSYISYDKYNKLFLAVMGGQTNVLNLHGQALVPWLPYDQILWNDNLIFTEIENETYCFDYSGKYITASKYTVKNILEEGDIDENFNQLFLIEENKNSFKN